MSVISQYWSSFCGVNTRHEITGENISNLLIKFIIIIIIIKVKNELIWFLLILKIDWVSIAKLYCLQQGKLTKVWDPQHLFPRHFIWISKIFFWETLSMSVFQMFLDFDWQFLHVRKVLLCYKRLLPLKMPFSTLRKLCYSYYTE